MLDPVSEIKNLTGGEGVDVVIESAGLDDIIRRGFDALIHAKETHAKIMVEPD
jgi:threonine dehydrogenase-like Zn-dependent dehydrogenase